MQCQSLLQGCGNPAADFTNSPPALQSQHVTAIPRPPGWPQPRSAGELPRKSFTERHGINPSPSSARARTVQTLPQNINVAGAAFWVGAGAALEGFYLG